MKNALVILPACLLALAHLISAQTISTDMTPNPAIDCEQVQNLSPECAMAFSQVVTEEDAAATFCSGSCFRTVLSAYESCGAAGTQTVQTLQQGVRK